MGAGLLADHHGRGGHSQGDFFVCDIFGAHPKDDLVSMEHPFFSLSTRPDLRVLDYAHNGVQVTLTPSVRGLATIHDKDILIYCISQLVAALNAGREVTRRLVLRAHDLLVATNRDTSGDAYKRLRDAFERLAGTRITTNIVTGDVETTRGFGMIEDWEIQRQTRGGRMISVAVTLSDWLFRAVVARSVLTLSREYFCLRKPLERRIYELARKHCGRQSEWRVSIAVLHHKSGAASPVRVFRKMVRDMVAENHLPEYLLTEGEGDVLVVTPRRAQGALLLTGLPPLSSDVLAQARALAPGQDIHALEAEWRALWASTGRPRLRSPGGAFLGWLKKRPR